MNSEDTLRIGYSQSLFIVSLRYPKNTEVRSLIRLYECCASIGFIEFPVGIGLAENETVVFVTQLGGNRRTSRTCIELVMVRERKLVLWGVGCRVEEIVL